MDITKPFTALHAAVDRSCTPPSRLIAFVLQVIVGNTMYSLIQQLGFQSALKKEFAPFLVSFLIAEFFFKFKSFALEAIAFLITWAILSFIQDLIVRRVAPSSAS
jgi:hypothetical protein